MKKMVVDIHQKVQIKDQDHHPQDQKILTEIENHQDLHHNILEEEVKMNIPQFM